MNVFLKQCQNFTGCSSALCDPFTGANVNKYSIIEGSTFTLYVCS